jgi:uncharacterized CHY-type Zn-finger protein
VEDPKKAMNISPIRRWASHPQQSDVYVCQHCSKSISASHIQRAGGECPHCQAKFSGQMGSLQKVFSDNDLFKGCR